MALTPDQITALGAACVAIASAASTAIYRWSSKAGRALRKSRRGTEALIEYIYALRRAAIAQGVPRSSLPRVPQVLRDLEIWSPDIDESEGDGDN